MNNNEEPDNDDIVLFSSGLQETKDGKLITTTEHLYEQMLVFNQKLEELADNDLPRMIKNTKREAIKKDLSEVYNTILKYKYLIAHVLNKKKKSGFPLSLKM